jgi:DNA repair ATPase RecN
LAGFGDVHLRVGKQLRDGRTVTRVEVLDVEERAREMVSMLGATGQAGHQSAEEMLASIASRKAELKQSSSG